VALWRRARRQLLVGWAMPALLFVGAGALPGVSRPWLNARDPDIEAIGRAAAARSGEGDTLFVWGNVPQLYRAAGRRPGARFPFCNYLTGLSPGTPSEHDPAAVDGRGVADAWPLLLEDLERRRPRVFVDTAAGAVKGYGRFPLARYPSLAAYVAAHYAPSAVVDGVVIHVRRD
jgi:hypothetical protein